MYFISNFSDRYEPYSVHRPNYKRHPKPPYSYAGMIIMAIQMSPDKRLSLSEIHQCINNMFPFFRGTYRGWKDSVRHILSSSSCFYKVSAHRSNKWTVDLSLAPSNALHRQETIVSKSQFWHPAIYQYLGVPEVVIPKKQLFTFRPTDFSNHGVPKVVIPEKQLLTHRSTDFSNHGVQEVVIPEKQLPTHPPTNFSNHGVPAMAIPEKQLPTHRPTDFSNHGVPAMAIPEKQLPTHRPTDFSIDRILTKTPELADDARPLHTFDTSPTFNTKMSLKLKTRKSSNRPKQTPALVKLINDSAAKWGVSTDAAMEEIGQICNIMTTTSTSSHILPTTSCQVIKSEVTDRPTYSSAQLPVSSQKNTKRDIIPSMPSTSTSQLYRPYLDNQSHVTGQQPPSTYQQQHNTDQYSQYVSQQYQQYYNEQIASQQYLQQYAIQQQYAMHQQYVYAEQHYQQQYVAQQQYEAQQQMSHYHGNQGYYQ
jgi:hypothetical protein